MTSYDGTIFVSSAQRDYGEPNDYYFHLDKTLAIKEICIQNVMLANSFYNITSSNNTVTTEDGTATLTAGFYNATEVVTELNTQLQALDATYLVSQSTITGKLTIARTGNFTITHTTLLGNLGFSSTQTLSGSATYTGSNIINLVTNQAVYVECPQLAPESHTNKPARQFLFKWCLKGNLNSFNSEYSEQPVSITLPTEKQISDLSIRLTDVNGNTLEPNGVDHSFSVFYR